MATTASATSNGKTPTSADLEKQIAQLREDISEIAKTVGTMGSAKGADAKARAREKVDDLNAASRDMIASLNEQVGELEDSVVGRVRERPFAALGIAAGIGFALALLARR